MNDDIETILREGGFLDVPREVRVPEDLWAEWQALAAKRGAEPDELLRRLMRAYLDQTKETA